MAEIEVRRGPGTCAWHTPPCHWSIVRLRWIPAVEATDPTPRHDSAHGGLSGEAGA